MIKADGGKNKKYDSNCTFLCDKKIPDRLSSNAAVRRRRGNGLERIKLLGGFWALKRSWMAK